MNEEQRRAQIINDAVAAAEEIIMSRSDGSTEETDFLTSSVARIYVEKVHAADSRRLGSRDILNTSRRKKTTTPIPLYLTDPHTFREQCLRCDRDKGNHPSSLDHDWTPASDCYYCGQEREAPIHQTKEKGYGGTAPE